MSDLFNHYLCAKKVYDNLEASSNFALIIRKHYDAYRLGAQGPDFLYYLLLSSHTSSAHELAKLIHTKKTAEFFYIGFKEALRLEGDSKKILLAYLLGFTTHYCLDTQTHPFIFSRTGRYTGEKSSRIYSYYHKSYETLLDTAFYTYSSEKLPITTAPEKLFTLNKKASKVIAAFYEDQIGPLYHLPIRKKDILKALSQTRTILKYVKDPKEKKKKILLPIERQIGEELILTRMLIHPVKFNEKILNLNYEKWADPSTSELKSESYPQLFQKAVDMCGQLFDSLQNLFEQKDFTNEDIFACYENLSYFSGRNSELEEIFKYFSLFFESPQDVNNFCG